MGAAMNVLFITADLGGGALVFRRLACRRGPLPRSAAAGPYPSLGANM